LNLYIYYKLYNKLLDKNLEDSVVLKTVIFFSYIQKLSIN